MSWQPVERGRSSDVDTCTEAADYTVAAYNLWLQPAHVLGVDERVVCQASSLHFLTENGFDFNKVILRFC